jgi:hypothetical protein
MSLFRFEETMKKSKLWFDETSPYFIRGGAPEDEKPETPPADPEKPVTPTFVPADDFKQFQAQITDTLSQMNEGLRALAVGRQPQRTEVADEPEVPLTELDEAMSLGKGADKFDKHINAKLSKAEKKVLARIQQVEAFGIGAISELVKDAAAPKMPYYDKTKHPQIAKEIDEHLKQLAPEMRLNKEVYIKVHDAVVGGHMGEIIAQEKEAAIRQATSGQGGGTKPAGSSRTHGTGDKIPTVEEFLGKDAADNMKAFGQDPDTFAHKWGYEDWPAYVKAHREGGTA